MECKKDSGQFRNGNAVANQVFLVTYFCFVCAFIDSFCDATFSSWATSDYLLFDIRVALWC